MAKTKKKTAVPKAQGPLDRRAAFARGGAFGSLVVGGRPSGALDWPEFCFFVFVFWCFCLS